MPSGVPDKALAVICDIEISTNQITQMGKVDARVLSCVGYISSYILCDRSWKTSMSYKRVWSAHFLCPLVHSLFIRNYYNREKKCVLIDVVCI